MVRNGPETAILSREKGPKGPKTAKTCRKWVVFRPLSRPLRRPASAGLDPMPFSLAIPEDTDGRGGRAGLGRVGVVGAFELEVGHLALDHARVAALAAGRQARGGDLAQQAGDKRGARSGLVRPRWKRGTARRRTRRVPVKLRRSGSRLARAAASAIVRRMARWASARP